MFVILSFIIVSAIFAQSPDTLYPVKVYTQDGYKYGYINHDGYLSIKPQFAFARDFSQGHAFVKYDNNSASWICINTMGNTLFEIEAEYAFEFKNGYTKMINKNDSVFYVDYDGKIFQNIPMDLSLSGKRATKLFKQNDKWGYKSSSGDVLLPAIYERAGEFSEGLAPVFIKFNESDLPEDNRYNAFIDRQGNIIIKAELKYDDRGHLESGYFYSPNNWVNGVCRYYSTNNLLTREVKYIRSDGKIIW